MKKLTHCPFFSYPTSRVAVGTVSHTTSLSRCYPASPVAVQPQPVRGGGAGAAGSARPRPGDGLRHPSQPPDRLRGL